MLFTPMTRRGGIPEWKKSDCPPKYSSRHRHCHFGGIDADNASGVHLLIMEYVEGSGFSAYSVPPVMCVTRVSVSIPARIPRPDMPGRAFADAPSRIS